MLFWVLSVSLLVASVTAQAQDASSRYHSNSNTVDVDVDDDNDNGGDLPASGLRLATFVDSYMVLQREPHSARIWGWAAPGANVTATLTTMNNKHNNIDNESRLAFDLASPSDGSWTLELPPQPAGAGHTLQVTDGATTITLEDIAFGDVFLCSGQSNMEFTVNASMNAEQEIADSIHYPNLRLATVNKTVSNSTMDNVGSKTPLYIWQKSSPDALNQSSVDGGKWGVYSATCYYFGRELYKSMNGTVPIGLVTSCWGGMKIETFSSADALADETCGGLAPAVNSGRSRGSEKDDTSNVDSSLASLDLELAKRIEQDSMNENDMDNLHPTDKQIWNAMLNPLLPMRFTGVIWYQGESNASNRPAYACQFPAMIADWRRKFQLPDWTFLYVELAALRNDYRGKVWPSLRAAQGAALALPNVGRVTAIDLGDPDSPNGPIHSRRKQEVGRRLAVTMRAMYYKDPSAEQMYSGPEFTGVELHTDPAHSIARLSFRPGTARGLHLRGTAACLACCTEPPFEILTKDQEWVRATLAQIRNEDEVYLIMNVTKIYGIRYAWEGRPECALYNGKGGPEDYASLPAAPFEWCAYPSGKAKWTNSACEVPLNDENTPKTDAVLDDSSPFAATDGSLLGQSTNTDPAKLRLPSFVDSHMVLQREPQKARIWGWAEPGANVTATLTKIDVNIRVITDPEDGAWSIDFPPQPAGDGHAIEITDGTSTIVLDDIAFGDVFLCSGQSNMEMTVGAVFDAEEEVKDAINYPNVRLATVAKATSDIPMDDVASPTYYSWARSSPESITGNSTLGWKAVFSATCYFFGRDLYQSMNGTVPIGLLVSCWGGQKVETFSSADALADETCGGTLPRARLGGNNYYNVREGLPYWDAADYEDSADLADGPKSMQLWNAMIHPLLPMRFVAALWYQGEANAQDATSYSCRFPAMITDWRVKFNLPNLSFVYVQLAGFDAGSTWPWVRAAQGAALQLPGVGMATAIDLGDPSNKANGDIHPRRKQEVGRRLALTMRAIQYRDPVAQFSYTGPELAGVGLTSSPTHSSIVLSFQPGTAHTLHLAGAAACKNCCEDPPFFVLDASGNWTRVAKADVRNSGDEIHLFTTVPEIFGIRYAWEPRPECILYNGMGGPDDHGGLAAAPFEWCAYPSGKPQWTNASCLLTKDGSNNNSQKI